MAGGLLGKSAVSKKKPRRLRIFFVRHGETTANASHMAQGHGQGELTEKGRVQAALLGRKLAQEDFEQIYCSDLQRACETLKIALKEMASARARGQGGVAPTHPSAPQAPAVAPLPAPAAVAYQMILRERDVGPAFEGQPYGAVQAAAKAAGEPPRAFRPPGGESWEDVYARAGAFLIQLALAHFDGGSTLREGSTVPPAVTGMTSDSNSDARGGEWDSMSEGEEGSGRGTRADVAPQGHTTPQLGSRARRGGGGVQQILVMTHGGFIKELMNIVLAHQKTPPEKPPAAPARNGKGKGLSGRPGVCAGGGGMASSTGIPHQGVANDADVAASELSRVLSCGMTEVPQDRTGDGTGPRPDVSINGKPSASPPTYQGTAKNTAIYKVELSVCGLAPGSAPRDVAGAEVSMLEDLNITLLDENNVTHLFCKEAALMFKAVMPHQAVAPSRHS
eukprot:jgi/Mesvir1/28935/Mv17719-RA.1